MRPPLFAFWDYVGTVGLVLLGGLLTLLSTTFVEARKQRRDSARESELRARRLRSASRLVRDELIQALVEIELTKEDSRSWSHEVVFSTREWDDHRETLADAIEDSGMWWAVTRAYMQIRDVNRRRGELPPGRPVIQDEDDNVLLDTAEAELEAAQQELSHVAEQAPERTDDSGPPEPSPAS